MKTDLSSYNNKGYDPGARIITRIAWHWVNILVFKTSIFPVYRMKSFLLRLFGAKVGKGVVIKPSVNIKYPWKLEIGNHVWLGEKAWIDNLDLVIIEDHVCISQGAMLLCGNHNYKEPSFDLITGPIYLEEGSWIGAKAVVCPGVTCRNHSILTVGSIASSDLDRYGIYKGNPAAKVKHRVLQVK